MGLLFEGNKWKFTWQIPLFKLFKITVLKETKRNQSKSIAVLPSTTGDEKKDHYDSLSHS